MSDGVQPSGKIRINSINPCQFFLIFPDFSYFSPSPDNNTENLANNIGDNHTIFNRLSRDGAESVAFQQAANESGQSRDR